MRRLLLLFALLPLLPGCRTPDYTPEEEAAAREIMFGRPFYDRGKGSPAEFITNQRGQYNPYGAVLRGEDLYPEAVKTLARLRNEAELGFRWKHPVPVARLPRLAAAPRIDGTPEAAEWRDALRFEGEFVMNRDEKTPQKHPSLWLAGRHDGHLYVAVRFPDEEIHAFREPEKRIYLGDSLELFVRPDKEENLYFEFIVNPDGVLWARKHIFSEWGGFFTLRDRADRGVRCAAKREGTGYSIEIAVPFEQLHPKWIRRPPQPGDSFSFMMVRTSLNKEVYTKNTPVPFLYDGHNVFGYFKTELQPRPGSLGENTGTVPGR